MSQSPESNSSFVNRCLQTIKRPSTLIATGGIILVFVVTYTTGRIWLKRNLPTWLETQLTKTLDRPVEIDKISNLSFNRITITGVLIDQTESDPDQLSIKEIDLGYNILPLLIGRPLDADLKVIGLQAYIAESEPGKWLELELPQQTETSKPPELPIKVDVDVELEQAVIELQPLNQKESVVIGIDGQGGYSKTNEQRVEYDLDTTIASGSISITGNTILDNGKSQLQIKSDPLNLLPIFSLIPNNLLTLETGEFQANLEANIAAKDKIEQTRGQGNISLNNLQGKITSNQETISADLDLVWEEQTIEIQQAQLGLGQLQGELTGSVNWRDGYQLQLNLNQIDITELAQSLELKLPVAIAGQLNSQININGALDNPQLTGTVQNITPIKVDKISLGQIQSNFTADLKTINIDNLEIEPTVGGKIQLTGQLLTNLEKQPLEWGKMPLSVNIKSDLPLEKLIASYYQPPSPLSLGNLESLGRIQGTLGNPAGKLQWSLNQGKSQIQGQGNILLQDRVINVYNTNLDVNEGNLEINAIANLDLATWTAQIESQNIALTPFLTTDIPQQSIILNQGQVQLAGNFNLEDIDNWSGEALLTLNVDQGVINLDSRLQSGQLSNLLQATQIQINPEITLNQAVANLSLPLALLKLEQNNTKTIEAIQGQIQADVNINNRGQLNTTTLISQGNWNTELNADQVQLSALADLLPNPLNAQIQLQGELKPLFAKNLIIPITVNQADLATGDNFLSSQGQVQLSLTDNQPEIDLVDLKINLLANLAEIPLETIVSQVNLPEVLTPTEINLDGQANFTGNLFAQQLLTNPLEKLNLVGELQLDNLNLNQRQFDPQLTGSVIIAPSQNISIDLRGNRDIISASIEPCNRSDCRLPYLPTGYRLHQGQGWDAIIVSGIRQGDQLVTQVSNFPLSLFNLAPGESFGIPGIVNGIVTSDLVIDLYTFATNGELLVDKPSLGYLETKALEAKFAYNPAISEAQLVDSSFRFRDTEYNFQANVDIDTGALTGKLDLNENDIGDIFKLLQWSNVNDVLRLFNSPLYTTAGKIRPDGLGNPLATIAQQVNLLWSTEQEIRNRSEQIRQGNAPLELDITGDYGGEILLGGNITRPQVQFNFEGKDWQWRTKPGLLDVIDTLGLVWETQEVILIPEILLAGNFSNGVLAVEPVRIQIEDAVLNIEGNFSLTGQKSEFSLENLSVDLINQFVKIPVPVTGVINLNAQLGGDLAAPSLSGEVTILDTTFNGKSLLPKLTGEFSYDPLNNAEFKTTFPETIELVTSIPSPTQETPQGIATLDLKLTGDVFKLLGVVTAEQLVWEDGEGNLNVNARLPLDWSEPLELIPLLEALEIEGNLNFEQALINNRIIDSILYLQGEVKFENQLIKIEDLTGTLANTKLSIAGVFPLVKPLSPGHRDVNNPLTIDIEEGNINLEELYTGQIDGTIVLTGTALSPVIGGEVILANGRVFIPESQEEQQDFTVAQELLGPKEETEPPVKIALKDFKVMTDNLSITQFSLYTFNFGGQLTLNGELTNLQNLAGDGLITLRRGEITFLNTQFFLARRHTSTLEFKGNQGLFNPDLDIQMETAISQTPDEGRQSGSNEIRDDIFQVRSNRIQVNIAIEGRANQLIPQLARDPEIACQLRSATTPPISENIPSTEILEQLATCVQLTSIAQNNQSNGNLLNSPIVELTSSPIRPKSEIIEILAGQFLGLAEMLQNSSGEELLQLGVDQFVIGPLFRDTIFTVEQFVGRGGKKIGLNDLRVYPVIENVFQIDSQSSVRLTYDYFFPTGQVRYEFSF